MTAAQFLRVIGQELDARGGVSGFQVVTIGSTHLVKGEAARRKSWFGVLTGGSATTESFERSYTADELQRLDDDGRTRRQSDQATPDPASLGHLLRTAGALVESAGGEFRSVRRKGRQLAIKFVKPDGRSEVREHSPQTLHEYSNWLYRQRRNR